MTRGVVFDVDGTLVDSNDAHARAWVDALAESGRAVSFARVRPMIGMGGDKLLPAVAGLSADSADGEDVARRRGAIFRERYLPELEAFDGARDLLAELKASGCRLGVASSAEERDLELLLSAVGLERFFEVRTSSDDAERSKPDPDIVTAALARLQLPPEDVIMVGDTPYDVTAAGRAGLDCIAFRCGGWKDRDLAGAVAVFDGPRDLLSRLPDSLLSGRGPR